MKFLKQGFAALVSSCLALGVTCDAFADQPDLSATAPAAATQQTPEQLQQLVAPIALYPDSLVAQILAASTYPVEIVEADRWVQAHTQLQGDALAAELDKQSWDPSVKALAEVPSVLANMDQNITWTSSLGDAYLSQPQALMAAVQGMRQRAKEAGYLNSTGQETVATEGQTIAVEPTDPDVVYVPEYDPWLVYGAPVAVWPGWYPYSGLYLDGPGIAFSVGFGVGFYGGYRWGWRHWRPDWHHDRVTYHHDPYVWRDRTAIDRDHFFHDHGTFNHALGGDRGLYGNAGAHAFSAPQHGFAGAHPAMGGDFGRFGAFSREGFGRGAPGGGHFGFDGMGHAGAEGHVGAFHGGGGHGGRG